MTTIVEARRVAHEHLCWAAERGMWPPDVVAAMGWRRTRGMTWGEAVMILAVEWMRMIDRAPNGRDGPRVVLPRAA